MTNKLVSLEELLPILQVPRQVKKTSRVARVVKAKKMPIPTEHQEQVALMQWAKLAEAKYPELALLYAIPNGGKRHIGVARKLRAEGVKSGVPDLCLPVARAGFHGLYIELKRQKNWKLSKVQKEWIETLEFQDNRVCICVGWEDARGVIEAYLNQWWI